MNQSGGHKILLVDDEADFCEIFSAAFARAGFVVQVARNGKEGIEKARSWRPDLIVMDMKMPVMNGAEAITRIRQDPELQAMKVVFLSNFGDPRSRETDELFARQIGAMGYLKKTDDLDSLVAQMRRFLE